MYFLRTIYFMPAYRWLELTSILLAYYKRQGENASPHMAQAKTLSPLVK